MFGHSFVVSFESAIEQRLDLRMERGMRLGQRGIRIRLRFDGKGGRKISEVDEQTASKIRSSNSEVLVLMLGGNDISFDVCAEEIAARIEAFAEMCVSRWGIRKVVVCQVMPRYEAPNCLLKRVRRSEREEWADRYVVMYRRKAREINRLLGIALFRSRNIRFWDHNGVFKSGTCRHKYQVDGIHLNRAGQWHLYKSLRGAITAAMRH